MYERILIPVDFGPCTQNAIHFARKLAAEHAAIHFLHVIDPEATAPFGRYVELDDLKSHAENALAKLVGADMGGLVCESSLRQGSIYKVVQSVAQDWRAELIVAGSHGRRGLPHLVLGSVAERVARDSDRPVVIVKHDVDPDVPLKKVAFATDFSDSAHAALDEFRRILPNRSGQLLHVLDLGGFPSDVSGALLADQLQGLTAKIGERLKAEVSALIDEGFTVEGKLLEGSAWQVIAEHAEKEGLELLIVGTHGYTGIDRFVLGSVAEKTLRSAPCPVMIVPSQPEDA